MGYDYVVPNILAQGSVPSGSVPFDAVVLCAKEHQNVPVASSMKVIRARLDDSGPPPTKTEVADALRASQEVTRLLKNGKRVLVTCAMGYNRSGFVTGLSLVNLGVSSSEAIRRIRRARGDRALSNPYFAKLIRIHDTQRKR